MNGRIFVCHHGEPRRVLNTSLFATIRSGAYDDDRTKTLGDLGGRNIAEPNLHSEMRHQYHVLHERLTGLDYVGFEHYRRLFFINPLNAAQMRRFDPELLALQRRFLSDEMHVIEHIDDRSFNSVLDLREIYDVETRSHVDLLMENYELITQRAHRWRIDQQWRDDHPADEWEILVDVVRNTGFFRRSLGLLDFRQNSIRFCNMYIMKTPLFLIYMDFWNECIGLLEPRVLSRERYFGYFAERIFNFFLYGMRLQNPGFRVGALPCVFDRQW